MADETNYHLVEFRKENDYLPVIVASPKGPVKTDPKEAPDFLQYVMDNKVRLQKKKSLPFYTKKTHWYIKEKKIEIVRNMDKVQLTIEHISGVLTGGIIHLPHKKKIQF